MLHCRHGHLCQMGNEHENEDNYINIENEPGDKLHQDLDSHFPWLLIYNKLDEVGDNFRPI